MPSDNRLSPLFDRPGNPSGDAIPVSQIPDKTESILAHIPPEPLFDTTPQAPSTPQAGVVSPVSSQPLPRESDIITPVANTLQALNNTLPEVTAPPSLSLEETPGPSLAHTSTTPSEVLEEDTTKTPPTEKVSIDAAQLAHYLQADRVYQSMLRDQNRDSIRLQIAIRYTLVMFAIFLVFAWIVSNRVIMIHFSEFVWLARIRDVLFAVMAGLFGLTLWFGSVSWTQNTLLITMIRILAVVFFGAILAALYIPF